MRAEHEHVFAAGTVVLLAPGADLREVTDQSFRELPLQMNDVRREPHLVGHDDLQSTFVRQRQNFVRLGECWRDGFLHVEMRAGFQ